ncbi:hypothetical protein AB0C21_31210 [Spirillospora sp. NPDC049024]
MTLPLSIAGAISTPRMVGAGIMLLVVVGMLFLGICAYQGRWRSWHGNTFFTWAYSPLAATWVAASVLLLVAAMIFADAPSALLISLLVLAVVCMGVAVVYAHPPRRMLPKWVRWLEGDEAVAERPACFEVHRDSRVNAIMRKLTLDDRQE